MREVITLVIKLTIPISSSVTREETIKDFDENVKPRVAKCSPTQVMQAFVSYGMDAEAIEVYEE